jgi:hypothetical protein
MSGMVGMGAQGLGIRPVLANLFCITPLIDHSAFACRFTVLGELGKTLTGKTLTISANKRPSD